MKFLKNKSIFLMIDVQERFSDVIFNMFEVVDNASILNRSAELLEVPLMITEQYPKGLGHTIPEIYIPKETKIYEKKKFSAYTDEVAEEIERLGATSVIIYGVETHVCLTQTALELVENGFKVGVISDAVSSRTHDNKLYALTRLQSAGIEILTTEMILFEFLESANHPKFREISKLIK